MFLVFKAIYKKYINNTQILEQLEESIRREIIGIQTSILQRVIDSFDSKLRHVIASDGSHFENMII
jgi:hypothetical protein